MNGLSLPATADVLSPSEPELQRDEIFDVLSNGRRRQVLHYLKQQDDRTRVELREIVDHVAAWENETTVEEVDATQRKRVYTALRQSHLPKMDDADIIEYDTQRGEVRLTDGAREAQLYLEYVPSEDIPWSHCYLGLAAVCCSLVALVGLGVYPFGGLPGFALAVIVATAFSTTAVVHAVQSSRNRLGTAQFETATE